MNFRKFIQAYTELNLDDFHDIIALRIKIFVIEQDCPYQDLDGNDKLAFHLYFKDEKNQIVAATRILPQNIAYDEVSIGRVVVDKSSRGTGLGHELMEQSMVFVQSQFGAADVRLSAQKHLENYYEKHGFKSTGKEYLEDGIPHVEMLFKS
ncbi:MAG: GNAT family N-acetyltransferase [Crocinitomicaceae bacterium]|jgi:ElaA protein|tara:strand:- start:41196 stop:41648 length:453 start_codon:yes stop_codon:yes gene_type:complete